MNKEMHILPWGLCTGSHRLCTGFCTCILSVLLFCVLDFVQL